VTRVALLVVALAVGAALLAAAAFGAESTASAKGGTLRLGRFTDVDSMRRLSLSLAFLVAGATLVAAAAVGSGSAQPAKGGTLRLSRFSDVDSVDPALAYTNYSWALEYATCAKLFNFPDAAGADGTRVIPEVVDRYAASRDGRTYTFELKKTFRFDSGAPVTARSFAEAFNRDANPKMRSPAVTYMHEIVGADAVMAGTSTAITGVRVLGRYRLQIRLTKRLGDFTARLTLPFFCPLLPNTPIEPAGIDDPAGSGPYYVAERVVNRRVVLKRNRFYRGNRPSNVDQIVYTVGPQGDACRALVEQDTIDYCPTTRFTNTAYREIVAKYGINRAGGQFFVTPQLNTWYLAFNHDRPAFKGPGQIALKQAINYAVDRPALARAFGYLAGRRTDQILPPALGRGAGVYPIKGADPATARRWLARAKLKPAKLVLYANASPTGVEVGQVFAFDLRQIGIEVDVRYYEGLTLHEKAGTRGEPYDVAADGWGVDYPDGAAFFDLLLNGRHLRETGNFNLSYLDVPAVNARIDAANRLTGETRRRAWAALDTDLMRSNPPWVPYVNLNSRDFVSRSFGCFLSHPVYGFDIAAACKK
jgi:peptide/nickel transport system substrate-binding protein